MRKWIFRICSLVLILTMLATPVLAASPARQNRPACSRYLDVDRDGICDNRPTDRTGNGIFVDEDGDGICDNRGENRKDCTGSRCGRAFGGQGKRLRRNR